MSAIEEALGDVYSEPQDFRGYVASMKSPAA